MARSLLFWILGALVCFIPFRGRADERPLGPYLQVLSPGTVSICLFNGGPAPVTARLRDPAGVVREAAASGRRPARADFSDLEPGVLYSYELSTAGSAEPGEVFTFWSGLTGEATLLFFGDTRSGDSSFDLDHRRLIEAVNSRIPPDAVVHTGDFVERGDDLNLWRSFFAIENELLAAAPIFPVIGRSDQPAALIREIFPLLAERPWYSARIGPVHLAVLGLWDSPNQGAEEVSPAGEQARWLRGDLSRARQAGIKYLLVAMREPGVDLRGRSSRAMREVFLPIFREFGVDAVFSGGHYFSHTRREGVDYFTDGGGGAELEKRRPPPGVFLYFHPVHHFLEFRADREGARVTAYDASGVPFYGAAIGEAVSSSSPEIGPTFVRTFPGGSGPAFPLTLFFQPDCGDCRVVEESLAEEAVSRGRDLAVTLRSLEDPGNRALLAALTDRSDPPPVLAAAGRVLVGREEISAGLESLFASAGEASPLPGRLRRWALPAAVALLSAAALSLLRRRGRVFRLLIFSALLAGPGLSPAVEIGEIYREANRKFENGRYPAALELYREAAVRGGDPDLELNSRLKIALILEDNLFDYPAARSAYREFLSRYGGTRPARLVESRLRALDVLAGGGELEAYGKFKKLEAEYHLLELHNPQARAEKIRIGRRIYDLGAGATGREFQERALERAAWIWSKEGAFFRARKAWGRLLAVAGEDERYRDLGEYINREAARTLIYYAALGYLAVILAIALRGAVGERLRAALLSPVFPAVLAPVLLVLTWYYYAVPAKDEYNTFGVFHLALLFLLYFFAYLLSCLVGSSRWLRRWKGLAGDLITAVSGLLTAAALWIVFAYHFDYLWVIGL